MPGKHVIYDNKDPAWINDETKALIKRKNGCIKDSGDLAT